jgi:tetratricopeptide (TPR) repeat protein
LTNIKTIALLLLWVTFSNPQIIYGQINPEDIAVVEDDLENNFYEALQQRAIENYDKAIVAIQKCLEKDTLNPTFYHELGKNALSLKQYPEAENAFKKAIAINPSERWYLNSLYDVYYETKEYSKSILIVLKLINFDPNMKEDLVSLYMYTKQHDKALLLLKEMENISVLSKSMEFYKLKIQENNSNTKTEQRELELAIEKNPKAEQYYIELMLLFSNNNQEEKAFEVAKKLAEELPNSEWAHVSLFKLYLDNNEVENAINSMFKVLGNKKFNDKIRHRMLNEFLIVTVNSNIYDKELEQAVAYFEEDKNVNVSKEMGKFFYNKQDFNKTILYLKKGLQKETNDLETVVLLIDAFIAINNFNEVTRIAEDYIDLYPTIANLYFYAGLGNNQINKPKIAIQYLESGLEFIVEDAELERNFYLQLSASYKILGNLEKESFYFSIAKQTSKSN